MKKFLLIGVCLTAVRKLDLDELSPIEESTSSQTPRRSNRQATRNVSYGAYLDVPSAADSSSEAYDTKSELDSSSEEDSSDSHSETNMDKSCSTPVRKINVNQINASALCTPKMKQVLSNSTAGTNTLLQQLLSHAPCNMNVLQT